MGMSDAPDYLKQIAEAQAVQSGVPKELFFGLIQTESAWNPKAISPAGARGLAQVMPFWLHDPKFAQYGFTLDQMLDPGVSSLMGAEILGDLLKRYGGNWALAAMAYNGGPGAVSGAMQRAGTKTDIEAISDNLKHDETRYYWQKVLNWAAYYGGRLSWAEAKARTVATQAMEFATSGGAASILAVALLSLGLFLLVRA